MRKQESTQGGDFLTQEEEELVGEGTEQVGRGMFPTQAEADPFKLFKDDDLRASIEHRHIVTIQMDENGEEVIVPHHFFTDESSVRIGSGLRDSEECDIALNKLNREGRGMN